MTGPYEPYITDPRHLEALSGTRYLVLRPSQQLAAEYLRVQAVLRALPVGNRLSFPAPHLTLKGYGTGSDEALVQTVQVWAEEATPPIVEVEAVDAFPDFRVLIVRIQRHASLVEAMTGIREASASLPMASQDEIAIEDWAFHMSLAYADWIEEDEWIDLQKWAGTVELARVSAVLESVDLVAFDGGPERLLLSAKLGR